MSRLRATVPYVRSLVLAVLAVSLILIGLPAVLAAAT
jgi:hypothetical protein